MSRWPAQHGQDARTTLTRVPAPLGGGCPHHWAESTRTACRSLYAELVSWKT